MAKIEIVSREGAAIARVHKKMWDELKLLNDKSLVLLPS